MSNLGKKRSEETKRRCSISAKLARSRDFRLKSIEHQLVFRFKLMPKISLVKKAGRKKGSIPWNKGKTGIYNMQSIEQMKYSALNRSDRIVT